jgi:hypothetical protein
MFSMVEVGDGDKVTSCVITPAEVSATGDVIASEAQIRILKVLAQGNNQA